MEKGKINHFKYDRCAEFLKEILKTCEGRNILNDKEEYIVISYYFDEKNFDQIGSRMNLTGSRVGQIFNRVSARLREHVSSLVKLHAENIDLKIELQREKAKNGAIPIKRILLEPFLVLDIDVRSKNCLKSKEIETLYDVVIKDDDFYLGIRNFGRASLRLLKSALYEKQLELGMNVYDQNV